MKLHREYPDFVGGLYRRALLITVIYAARIHKAIWLREPDGLRSSRDTAIDSDSPGLEIGRCLFWKYMTSYEDYNGRNFESV